MKLNRRIAKSLVICMMAAVLTGCNEDNDINNADVTQEVKTKESKEIKQKLTTSNGSKHISFISQKHIKFWDAIVLNYIDKEYNATTIKKGNIRLYTKANKDYAQKWFEELEASYKVLKEILTGKDEDVLETQYEEFKKYYDNTDKMYTYVLSIDDEYDSKVDGNYKIRQYYALADDVRSYTILLKEYIYMLKGNIEFYTEDKDNKKKDDKSGDKIVYADNSLAMTYSIVTDMKFRDVVSDRYEKKAKCSIKGLDNKKALKKATNYKKYWNEEKQDNYDVLKEYLKGEHKDILKDQDNAFIDFVDASIKLHGRLLLDTKIYTSLYKNNIKVENQLYKASN